MDDMLQNLKSGGSLDVGDVSLPPELPPRNNTDHEVVKHSSPTITIRNQKYDRDDHPLKSESIDMLLDWRVYLGVIVEIQP